MMEIDDLIRENETLRDARLKALRKIDLLRRQNTLMRSDIAHMRRLVCNSKIEEFIEFSKLVLQRDLQ